MAELVDALDSGSSWIFPVDVRVILAAMTASFQKRTAIVANGEILDYAFLKKSLSSYSRIVAVDGGLLHCRNLQIEPHFFVGDMDSASLDLVQKYPHMEHLILPQDKDQTDLEAALEFEAGEEDTFVTVFGALGLRIDHALGNIYLLARYPKRVWIESETEYLFSPGKIITLDCEIGQTLSLLPLIGPAEGIQTHGLKWELQGRTLDKSFFGLSNICLKKSLSIQVRAGDLLCCLQKVKAGSQLHPFHTSFSNC